MSTAEKGSATTKTPADFLKSIRGRPVVVKLNSGVDYRVHATKVTNKKHGSFAKSKGSHRNLARLHQMRASKSQKLL